MAARLKSSPRELVPATARARTSAPHPGCHGRRVEQSNSCRTEEVPERRVRGKQGSKNDIQEASQEDEGDEETRAQGDEETRVQVSCASGLLPAPAQKSVRCGNPTEPAW